MSERNGLREIIVPNLGLFPVVRLVAAPGLDVTGPLKARLRRIGLRLPARAEGLMPDVDRTPFPASDWYYLAGPVLGTPQQAIDDFVPLCKGRRIRLPEMEQITGKSTKGGCELVVQAFRHEGRTWMNVSLDIPR